MNKKIILITVLVLAIFFSGCLQFDEPDTDLIAYSEEITAQEKYCETDEDCQLIELSCCPNPYGSSVTSINKNTVTKISEWKQENCQKCQLEHWLTRFSFLYRESYCEKNECKMKVLPECESITSECVNRGKEKTIKEFTQSELDALGMTAEEVLEYCEC